MAVNETEAYWRRKIWCERIAELESEINVAGTEEYSGERKHRYYRTVWNLQQAVKMLQSMNESTDAKVIEIGKP